jgi:hypothetical protein
MIAGCQYIRTCSKEIKCGISGYAKSSGGIFSVNDDEVRGMLLPKSWKDTGDSTSARCSNDISYE